MEQTSIARKKLDRLLEAVDPDRVGASREVLRAFARALLLRAPAELVERRPADHTLEDVYALFALLRDTPPEEIGVRVRLLSGEPSRSAVETVMPDCAFIVNTIRETLHGRGLDIPYLLHPVFVAERDEQGQIVRLRDRSEEGFRTSLVHAVVEGYLDEVRRQELEAETRSRLERVREATGDYRAMLERSRDVGAELAERAQEIPWRAGEFDEIRELLRWLEEDGFLFLGYRAYRFWTDEEGRRWVQVEPGTGLGILRDETRSAYRDPRPVDELPPGLRARVLGGPLLIISKSNSESPVQRRERMDYIGIKRLGPNGEVEGEHRFLGLFTARALQQDPSTVPILRRKLREILEAEGAAKGSHDYNVILQVFNSMPKEELFLSSVSEIAQVIEAVMETEGADDVRVTAHPDALARGVNVCVILPRHRFSDEVREKIQEILVRAYDGSVLNYHLALGESDQARLHFYLGVGSKDPASVDVGQLEGRLRESVRSWEERLSDALERTYSRERAHELADRHVRDFSAEYKATMDVRTAVEDIERLETLETTGVQQVVLEEAEPGEPNVHRLKVFAPRGRFVLSDVMPTLENLGFRVLEADKYDIAGGERASTIHTFQVQIPEQWGVDRTEAEPRVAAVLRAVQGGWTEDDRLNSLVLSARLDWYQVAVLRAYAGYAFRIGAVGSRYGVQRPLVERPGLARLLYRIFESLLDPAQREAGEASARRFVAEFHEELRSVASIEDDRTYRRLLNLVLATVRTNAFHERPAEGPFLVALKFDCHRIEVMPRPRPKFEVYLNGPCTEAAHLRMGPVARGGIRWSDRREDFRVEVLGLVKTQQVKNAVIVPEGAKGAFIVKRPKEGADPATAAVESYREFIGTLLDLSDNIVSGQVRHPPRTVVRDGEDPYLVVAADKGTARLSDAANELAAERGFWLGDAFASGGTRGYDHKELGITARGAWESVKRHFRELGRDIQREPFTVVGIGDMSGDVFGNGMLLSKQIRLLAAFDHRHIFVDPDPDPETSWAERRRLYELPGSSWMDYRPELLSAGGAVFDRGAKEIALSPEARAALGIPAEEEPLNGEGLIRHVLRAPVDLLWNGGIGTYVKASTETHAEVGDPGNDAVRVDASELRARVVGEGGNLGFTPRARVEFALRGGRLNTDALDNSAGVDTSDHEVNLKILLNAAVEEGELDEASRVRLLHEATDEVASAVLANNYSQSLAVSLDEHRVQESPAEFRDTLISLEREGLLDRAMEELPTTEELLERQEEGRFLTRPELALILAYAKMHLKRCLLRSGLPDDPALHPLLRGYFPRRVLASLPEEGEALLRRHRLRRNIVATVLTNRFVDRMGSAAHLQLTRETGKEAHEVVRQWYVASEIGGAERLFVALRETDDRVPAGVQYQWYREIAETLGRATLWLLAKSDPDMSTTECVKWFREPVAELTEVLPDLLPAAAREQLEERRRLYETDGLDPQLAAALAAFGRLDELLPVALLARETGLSARVAGAVYFGITEEIDFPWLQSRLARLPKQDLWVQRAAKTLSLELELARAEICRRILVGMQDEGVERADRRETDRFDVRAPLEAFRRMEQADLQRIRQVIEDVRTEPAPGLPALVVAVHAIRTRGIAGVRDD